MLNEQTLTIMNALKLFGMAHSFSERLSSPQHSDLSHEEFVGLLVQDDDEDDDLGEDEDNGGEDEDEGTDDGDPPGWSD